MTNTPAHLAPEACYVCGGAAHQPTTHNYTSNADAEAWFAYQPPTDYSPEAAYVAEYRPY